MGSFADTIDQQFKELLKAAREHIRAARESEMNLPPATTSDIAAWVTRCGQMISIFATENSEYYQQYVRAQRTRGFYQLNRRNYRHLCLVEGALTALYDDYRRGMLRNLTGTLQTELLADFLENARCWVDAGKPAAAATLAGAVLEAALQRVAALMGIAVQEDDGNAKPAEEIDQQLFNEGIYDKLLRGQVRDWLGLYRQALDGPADQIKPEQVTMMLQFVRKFCADHLS
jgi:hypothetical protein